MAEQLLNSVRDAVDGQIDFHGQRLVEQLTTNILSVVGLIALIVGYATQNIQHTLWVGLGGTALTFVALVPGWPVFNRHPERWLPARNALSGVSISVDGQTAS